MYQKSIFTELATGKMENDLFQKRTPVSTDIKQARVVYSRKGETNYQFFDIRAPYLIVYEAVDPDTDQAVYMEFGEDRQVVHRAPYTEYRKIDRRLHNHDFYEITYVLSGQVTMLIEDENVRYSAGECCICNKHIHHLKMMDEKTELVLFLLKEDYLLEFLNTCSLADPLRSLKERYCFFDHFFAENSKNSFYDAKLYADFRGTDQAQQDIFLNIFNQMIEEITSLHMGKSFMMRALFSRFIENLQTGPSCQAAVHSAKLSREEQVVFSVAQAYQERASIMSRAEIEKLTGYCSDHVERIIKRHTGMTLSEYGRLFTLQRAASLLHNSEKSIGEICEETGYTNRTFFNQIFKKRYGVTPAEYRKRLKMPDTLNDSFAS